jgi:hypothetical protein
VCLSDLATSGVPGLELLCPHPDVFSGEKALLKSASPAGKVAKEREQLMAQRMIIYQEGQQQMEFSTFYYYLPARNRNVFFKNPAI